MFNFTPPIQHMKSYYVVIPGGTPQGPFDEQTIKQGIADGTYPSSASVFCEGMTNWEPITAHFPPAPMPMPVAAMPVPPAPAPVAPAPMPMPAAPASVTPAPMPMPAVPAPVTPAPMPMPAVPAPVLYHVSVPGGQSAGPYTVEDIRTMLSTGQLAPNSLVWNEKLPNWVPVQQILTSGATYNFGQAISSCFKRYATFEGRASRAEFWWFFLFSSLLGITYIGWLATLLPLIAVGWRRMHDVGKPGIFSLIPVYSIILCCKPSQGPNKYGSAPNPPA